MNCYIQEKKRPGPTSRTAWSKARTDAEAICADAGWTAISIVPPPGDRENAGLAAKLAGHVRMDGVWRDGLSRLSDGDTLLIQLPVIHNCLFLARALRRARDRGVRVIGLVHDLESLRMSLDASFGLRTRARMHIEETGVLGVCDRLVVHNDKMRALMAERGVPDDKMISLGLFDYLMTADAERAVLERDPAADYRTLVVAGNLSADKAGYIYALPPGLRVNLYGVYYDGSRGAAGGDYRGAFAPDELPAALEGGFGLVWDGPDADTCRGVYGEYLRYNNPHKASLYLASGLPVVIWSGAALAETITAAGAGFAVGSLGEAAEVLRDMTAADYAQYRANAAALGAALRRGQRLRTALGIGGEGK